MPILVGNTCDLVMLHALFAANIDRKERQAKKCHKDVRVTAPLNRRHTSTFLAFAANTGFFSANTGVFLPVSIAKLETPISSSLPQILASLFTIFVLVRGRADERQQF